MAEQDEKRQKSLDANKRLRERRQAAGLCVRCGVRPARAGRQTCTKCATKQRIAHREAYRSSGTCEYAEGLEDLGEYACLHCPRPGGCKYEEER